MSLLCTSVFSNRHTSAQHILPSYSRQSGNCHTLSRVCVQQWFCTCTVSLSADTYHHPRDEAFLLVLLAPHLHFPLPPVLPLPHSPRRLVPLPLALPPQGPLPPPPQAPRPLALLPLVPPPLLPPP